MAARKCNELLTKYPDLAKGKFGGFEVGDGWYDILDTLCGMITNYVNQHNEDVQSRLDKITAGTRTINEFAPDLLKVLPMPRILQVKEKFGTLRFYIDGGDKRIHTWIEFAEALSATVCEECGCPGTMRYGSWIRCLCDTHEAEYQSQRNRS